MFEFECFILVYSVNNVLPYSARLLFGTFGGTNTRTSLLSLILFLFPFLYEAPYRTMAKAAEPVRTIYLSHNSEKRLNVNYSLTAHSCN